MKIGEGINIKANSFKAKLVIMFIVPSFAFLYFLYLFIQNEYLIQDKISKYQYSTKVMLILSELVHNLQLERGLSAGYVIYNEVNLKTHLLEQYKSTDNAYNKLFKISKKSLYSNTLDKNNQHIISNIIELLKDITTTRELVITNSIDFEREINYYSKIDNLLILSIKNINSKFIILENENSMMNNLLQIEEYAGLERAYTYNFLLSQAKTNKTLLGIQQYIKQRKNINSFLLLGSSENSISIYNKLYKKDIEEKNSYCSKHILNNDFSQLNAKICFSLSSKYIDMLDNIYQNILNSCIDTTTILYENSLKKLYFVYIIAVISIFMVLVLFYLLFRLINREEKNKVDLRIAAYTFEAQEGVVITDEEGVILKVNKSFTKITGYTADEAPGNTPRILKSNQHPESFYKNIWDTLTTEGKWQGEIINKRKNGEFYNEMLSISSIKNEDGIITHYIAQFLDISEIKKAHKALQHQIDHDFLSGLLNRKGLRQRLKEAYSKAKRHNVEHAFLFIDLDNFKNINDTYGHDIGDKLIVEVAQRMKIALREEDVVARLSGDEFGVLITNLTKDKKEVEFIATKLLHAISKEMILDKHCIKISSSIGIKFFPQKNSSFEDIIIHADNAMYQAKKQGKNQFVFYKD